MIQYFRYWPYPLALWAGQNKIDVLFIPFFILRLLRSSFYFWGTFIAFPALVMMSLKFLIVGPSSTNLNTLDNLIKYAIAPFNSLRHSWFESSRSDFTRIGSESGQMEQKTSKTSRLSLSLLIQVKPRRQNNYLCKTRRFSIL